MSESKESSGKGIVKDTLKESVTSWGNTLRTLTLIAGLAIAIVICVDYLNKRGYDIIVEGDKSVTIRASGKSVTIVDVPAYQLAVPSGVTLKADRKLTIRATGLVSTLTTPMCDELKAANDLTGLKTALINVLHRQAFHMDWRHPDGQLYYVNSTVPWGPTCQQIAASKMKVHPDAEWGTLLAFIVPKDCRDPEKYLADIENPRKQILKIGRNASLIFAEGKFGGPENTGVEIGSQYIGCDIYFTINDAIVRTRDDLRLSKKCNEPPNDVEAMTDTVSDECCGRMKDPEHPYGIWYLDNRGSFSVSMVEEKS